MAAMLFATVQAILNGVLTGSLYALIGMGMALIFGVMRIPNFAHGAFMMIAMYAVFLLSDQLGVTPYLGFLIAGAVMFVIGVVSFRFLVRKVVERTEAMQILLTLGMAQILTAIAQRAFGADFRQINSQLVGINLHFGKITLNAAALLSFAITIALGVGMFLFVMKSRLGRALRAIAQNRYAASLMGIDVQRIQALSFGLGLAAVGFAGGLLLPAFYLYPEVGSQFTLKSFVIVVLGGMGSVEGAAIAGVVLGVVESMTSLFWGNEWAIPVDFVIFLLVLSFRPSGLFGSQRV
jgi:branched-chain amino acid transport system permease protein